MMMSMTRDTSAWNSKVSPSDDEDVSAAASSAGGAECLTVSPPRRFRIDAGNAPPLTEEAAAVAGGVPLGGGWH